MSSVNALAGGSLREELRTSGGRSFGMDLTSLTDEKLSGLILEVQAEQRARLEKRTSELLASFRTQAEALGLEPAKLAAALIKRTTGRPRAGGTAADARASVAPKWRNPADPMQTWAGRGAKPKWIELGKDGRPLPKFAVSASP